MALEPFVCRADSPERLAPQGPTLSRSALAFFHQNAVAGMQGGIERYIATLLDEAQGSAFLVTELTEKNTSQYFGIPLPLPHKAPQWIRYILGVFSHLLQIRAFLRAHDIRAMEFSRPEYALFGMFLRGRKTFTFHGTGPLKKEKLKWLLHFSSCWLLPFCADAVHIVGRNPNGLPRFLQRIMAKKICFLDAWFDDCFTPCPYPETQGVTKIFYAGRLATAKNPELLFDVIRALAAHHASDFSFDYFGGDGALFPSDIQHFIKDHGLLSAPQLATHIRACHFGILTSWTEGSPFIVVESLACGRGFLVSPIEGLIKAYGTQKGVFFAKDYSVESYISAILAIKEQLAQGNLAPHALAEAVKNQSKKTCTQRLLAQISGAPLDVV